MLRGEPIRPYRFGMQLLAHPDTIGATIDSIKVVTSRTGACWHFHYRVEGAADLVLPAPRSPGRADGLWKHLCFEAFVGLPGGAYLEFNFAPSGQWAAYRFDAYRSGMREEPATMLLSCEAGPDWFTIDAKVDCAALVANHPLGLSAVIEEESARKSYWALGHPTGAPDFHDPACFRAVLTDIAQ